MVGLATTSLREFWPSESRTYLLGRWCLSPSERAPYFFHPDRFPSPNPDQPVIPYYLDNEGEFTRVHSYVGRVYEKLFSHLAHRMNEIHQTNRDLRYWRIWFGSYLSMDLEILYDRYRGLKDAQTLLGNFKTVGLDERDFIHLPDFQYDSSVFWTTERYQLQVYTQLSALLGISLETRRFPTSPTHRVGRKALREYIRAGLRNAFLSITESAARRALIAVVGLPLSLIDAMKLWVLSRGRIVWCPAFREITDPPPLANLEWRQHLAKDWVPSDEFESVAMKMVQQNLPLSFLEGYPRLLHFVRQQPHRTKVWLSQCWTYHEAFRLRVAESLKSQSLLVGCQHGGYYGMLESQPPEDFERRIADQFYSWGWTDDSRPPVRPMPAFKLMKNSRHARRGLGRKKKHIVFVGTGRPPYTFYHQSVYQGPQMEAYFKSQGMFVGALSPQSFRDLRIRLGTTDYGWDLPGMWRNAFPDIAFDTSKRFEDLFARGKLFVVDHPATTFLETLSYDLPTILFWDPRGFRLRPSATTALKELERAGIYFSDPAAAARKVNEISSDPEKWWRQSEIQRARREFCLHYARREHNTIGKWARELLATPRGLPISFTQPEPVR
jgi:putative transferase (TIGR04331 family)